jgi:predicted Zn-ribbon and HTH transcriptional regulator
MEENKQSPGNQVSDNSMRICVNTTEREIDLDKERVVKGEQLTNNNNSSIESSSLDNNTHMNISLDKLKNKSENNGTIHLWLGKDLKKAVIKARIDVSEFVRNKLLEELRNKGIVIEVPDPEFIIKVRCPNCGFKQNATTIKQVRCFNCQRYFRVYVRGRSRIVGIVKGSKEIVFRYFNRIYGRRS